MIAVIGLATVLIRPESRAQPVNRPDSLPSPPPLPQELIGKRPPAPPPDLPDPSELMSQLRQLEELLSLPPEKLAKLRETIEFIEKMSPSEREAMRIRLVKVTRLTPELEMEIAQLKQHLPKEKGSDLAQFWLAAKPADRDQYREALRAMDDPAKGTYLSKQVSTFVQRRDKLYEQMRDTLSKREGELSATP